VTAPKTLPPSVDIPAAASPGEGATTPRTMRMSEAGDDAACFMLHREMFDPGVVARFTIDGEPVSKARARFTNQGSKTRAYTPEKTHNAEQVVAWKFRAAAPRHKPDTESTYGVMALFFSATRQRRDVDNMLKLILDGLNKIAWADDDQVVEVSGRKTYVPGYPEDARTEVVVYRVGSVHRQTETCENCGNEYASYASWHGRRRFCSRECFSAWRLEQRLRKCQHCGDDFAPKNVIAPPKFCSRACADAARRATVTCSRCGKEFTKQRCHVRALNFCTTECRESHWREHRKAAAKGTCETCGGPTSKKTYRQCRPCKLAGTALSGKPEAAP
jgi:crossover junction endodeoxyribonuclease RusA